MQLSNGAIKVKSSTAAALATKAENHEIEGVDLETFDLSAFVAPSPSAVAVRGAGKEIRIPEVEKFLVKAQNYLRWVRNTKLILLSVVIRRSMNC